MKGREKNKEREIERKRVKEKEWERGGDRQTERVRGKKEREGGREREG